MRKIDHDAELIAGFYQFSSRIAQTGARIRRMGEFKWNTLGKRIGATPGNAQGAQARLIKHIQGIKAGIDGFSPLEM